MSRAPEKQGVGEQSRVKDTEAFQPVLRSVFFFSSNLTQAGVVGEEGTSVGKMCALDFRLVRRAFS